MGPGNRYIENLRCPAGMTSQSGTWVFNQGVLYRTVLDFEPKSRYVLDSGYSGHYERNAPPPGGAFRITFTSPNSMVWQDLNGGSVTYVRK